MSDFYKHSQMADGLLGKCKSCTREDVRKNRSLKLEKVREYDRARGNRQSREYFKAYAEKNPDKYKAKNAVNNAIRDGKLDKPDHCWRCGSTDRIEGHHWDYDRPLDVEWVCSACHSQIHARIKRFAAE